MTQVPWHLAGSRPPAGPWCEEVAGPPRAERVVSAASVASVLGSFASATAHAQGSPAARPSGLGDRARFRTRVDVHVSWPWAQRTERQSMQSSGTPWNTSRVVVWCCDWRRGNNTLGETAGAGMCSTLPPRGGALTPPSLTSPLPAWF